MKHRKKEGIDNDSLHANLGSKEKKEEDDDSLYASLGCMFEGNRATTLKHYEWTHKHQNTNSKRPPIHVALRVVDEEPGALQSGHYLWPASKALCDFLASSVATLPSDQQPKTIIELGAGCALVSLAALQIFQESLQYLVISDHDTTTLERARDSHETTLEELYERAASEEEKMDIINETSSIPVEFEALEWGREDDLKHLREATREHNIDPTEFDMILGSDLIYSWDVVEPLFQSVSQLMSDRTCFFLSQSFGYDNETEREIDRLCNKLQLERISEVDKLSSEEEEGKVRIQSFRRKIPESK